MVELPDEIELTAPQTRVLGCLLEKQATTPDAYPLTLKALTAACNQSSSRDPVVDYEAQLVETTCHALKAKGLLRIVHPASGERATKYRQVADEALALGPAEQAVLCVLLLRGAQTVPELRARTERMHPFGGADEVEAVLSGLASRDRALTRLLDRRPGQREPRWIQLLQADPDGRAAIAATATDTTADRAAPSAPAGPARTPDRGEQLEGRVAALEARVEQLVAALHGLVDLPGSAPGPTGDTPPG
jgi:uncharacterized protein